MGERYKKLTLLHSNDMHGDFLAEKVDDKLVGGVSMLSGYINKVRAEDENVLYCIAGDMFRGSIIDSEFRGVSTIEIMNMLSPDVVTIGNHETDYGIAHLLFLEKMANFPIINANFFVKSNGARLFKSHELIEIGGMKILFIGIVTEEILSQSKGDGLISTFVDIAEAATAVGKICDAFNAVDVDFTVLLTHIGFEEDQKLAAILDPAWGVDVIIGGHSHTFITEPAKVNDILIVQAGTGTDQIGRFDIIVDTDNNCVESYEWQPVPIDAEHCPSDPVIEKFISEMKHKTDHKYGRILTKLKRQVEHLTRYRQTELGGIISDALKNSLGLDVMFMGSGSVRKTAMGPIITKQDLLECCPYNDPIYMIKITGKTLRECLLYLYRDEAFDGEHTEFFQLSDGLHVKYSRSQHEILELTFNGRAIQDTDVFSVGIQKFALDNLDLCFHKTLKEMSSLQPPRVVATAATDVIEEYLQSHKRLDGAPVDRLEVVD